MVEHVGHEYMEEFFGCCESLLAEDGLFVLQVIKQMMSYIYIYIYIYLFPSFIIMSWSL